VNAVFRRLPAPIQRFVVRAKMAWARYWVNPTVPPKQLGLVGKHEYRPAMISLGFKLYADGDVVFINRWGADEKVSDPHLVGLVHREYNRLVAEAKRQARIS